MQHQPPHAAPSENVADTPAAQRFATFEEFWPYYLGEHRHPVNRALHFMGTSAAMATLALGAATANPLAIPAALAVGYGPAWIGHFFIEKNKPASFKYPLWSFRGDFRMYRLMLSGKIAAELAAIAKK
jgi:hypothetical protein